MAEQEGKKWDPRHRVEKALAIAQILEEESERGETIAIIELAASLALPDWHVKLLISYRGFN
jgi:hypothetical protein